MPVKPAKHLKHAEERHRPITAPHCCCFHTNAGICLTLNDEYCGSDECLTLSVVYLTSVLIVTSILAMAIVVTVTSVVTVMSVVAVKSVRIMRG